ncbi:hypothetical protein VNO80_16741 [Phaseolus coccineus]|uniref:Uncharacterized protein n=1 Tax=Phaseolus coccineus TaxID=3886 RepID=A0AAN9R0G4_PHACN
MLPGPKIRGGEDRDKEGRKGESLSLVEQLKIGKAEAMQCTQDSASGELRSATKPEGSDNSCHIHRCSNEGSLSYQHEGPQTSCINRACEEGGGDSVGVENNFEPRGEEGAVEVDGSKTSMKDQSYVPVWARPRLGLRHRDPPDCPRPGVLDRDQGEPGRDLRDLTEARRTPVKHLTRRRRLQQFSRFHLPSRNKLITVSLSATASLSRSPSPRQPSLSRSPSWRQLFLLCGGSCPSLASPSSRPAASSSSACSHVQVSVFRAVLIRVTVLVHVTLVLLVAVLVRVALVLRVAVLLCVAVLLRVGLLCLRSFLCLHSLLLRFRF